MKLNLKKFPIELISEIVFIAIINELTYKNFKEEPSILSSSPIFLRSLKYFSDKKWKIICNIIFKNKIKSGYWRNTFVKLQTVDDLELFKLSLNGDFSKIRIIDITYRYRDRILLNDIISAIFKFSDNLKYLESHDELGDLLQILREITHVRIESKSFNYFYKLLEDLKENVSLNGSFNNKYESHGIHILRELRKLKDESYNMMSIDQELDFFI